MKTFDIDDSGFEFMQGIRRCGAFVYREDISEGEKKMKIFDIKDVFSWSNAEQAKAYIGKYCYFADSLRYLKIIINKDEKYILKDVFDNEKDMVQGVFCDVDGDFWGL